MNDNELVVCPVSGDHAIQRPSAGDFIEYDCPSCGVFRISRTALALVQQNPGLLQTALELAKQAAEPGEVPMISNVTGG